MQNTKSIFSSHKRSLYGGLLSSVMGLASQGCQAPSSQGSATAATESTRESSIRDLCKSEDHFCHEVLHATNGGHFSYADEKVETTTLSVALGYFGDIVDAGINRNVEFIIETEKSVAVYVDWLDKKDSAFMRDDGFLNYGTNDQTMWIGRCTQNIKSIKAKTLSTYALVYKSGIRYDNEVSTTMEVERWRLFKVIRDANRDKIGKYAGKFKSQYTVKEMFTDCFSDNPRLYGDQIPLIKKDLATWAKNNLVIQAPTFGLYNATGSHLVVKAPDGKKFLVGDRRNQTFDRQTLNKSYYVFNPTFGSCYKWTPKKLDFNYWAVLKTPGVGGCQHAAGCFDVNDDVEGPTFHHHGAKGPCAGMDQCELSEDAAESQGGACLE